MDTPTHPDYDFSLLTREQAIENVRQVLRQQRLDHEQHALLDASLALVLQPAPISLVDDDES